MSLDKPEQRHRDTEKFGGKVNIQADASPKDLKKGRGKYERQNE
jgi:hypothetical protein